MLSNWLFGPLATRSFVLDLDDVRDLARTAREAAPGMNIRFAVGGAGMLPPRDVTDGELAGLSSAERSRLVLYGRFDTVTGVVEQITAVDVVLQRKRDPQIVIQPYGSEPAALLVARLRQVFVDSKRPRIWLRGPSWAVRYSLPFAAILGSFVWVLLSTPLTPALVLFGCVWVALGLGLTVYFVRRELQRSASTPRPRGYPGIKILGETRSDTSIRRADSHANIRVAAITALIAIPTTVAGTLFITWLSVP